MNSVDMSKKVLLAIYGARLDPAIFELSGVYEDLCRELKLQHEELLTIIRRLEAEGWIKRTGKGSINSFVMTPEGAKHVGEFNKTLIDKLVSSAANGWPSILAVLIEHVLKSDK